jgi:hypothetical protein
MEHDQEHGAITQEELMAAGQELFEDPDISEVISAEEMREYDRDAEFRLDAEDEARWEREAQDAEAEYADDPYYDNETTVM